MHVVCLVMSMVCHVIVVTWLFCYSRLKKPVTDLTSHSRPVSNVPAATPRPQVPSNVELPEEETAPSWLTKHNDQTASIGGGEVNSWAEPGNAAMSVFKALRKEDDDENDDDNDDDDDDDAINDSDEETMTLEQTDVGMFGTWVRPIPPGVHRCGARPQHASSQG